MKHTLSLFKVLLSLLFPFVLMQCTSTYETITERGSLSEAMEKSSDDYTGERKVADTKVSTISDEDDDDDDESWFSSFLSELFSFNIGNDDDDDDHVYRPRKSCNNRESHRVERKRIEARSYGVTLSSGLHFTKHYPLTSGLSLRVSHQNYTRNIHSAEFGYRVIPLFKNSPLQSSLSYLGNVSLGYLFRRYCASESRSTAPFFSIGADAKVLLWRYRNTVYTDVYDEFGSFIETREVDKDAVLSLSPTIGTGITFLRDKSVRPSVGVRFGGTFYPSKTVKSFTNDVFKKDLFVKLNFTIDIGID